jgi:hypothetical protein
VLLGGTPVADARVVFSPVGHENAAAGKTDAAGRFRLTTFDADDGAAAGEYQVMVMKFTVIEHEGGGVTETHDLPEKYRDPAASGLKATVPEGGVKDLKFELVK